MSCCVGSRRCWRQKTELEAPGARTQGDCGRGTLPVAKWPGGMMNEEPRIAVFVDFENLALGVRETKRGDRFDVD